jgi:hypothetical protein
MSEEASEKLLFEEHKNAFEHLRFLETKRDRFVIGSIAASGAVLALIVQVFSKEDFRLRDTSIEFVVALAILCLSLGFLSWLLRHYENVLAIVRSATFGEKSFKIDNVDKPLVAYLDIRANELVTHGRIPLSDLSKWILFGSRVFWFLAGISLFVFLFTRC